jgi:hypothetical protein
LTDLLETALTQVLEKVKEISNAAQAKLLLRDILNSAFYISSDTRRKLFMSELRDLEGLKAVVDFASSLIDDFDTVFDYEIKKYS